MDPLTGTSCVYRRNHNEIWMPRPGEINIAFPCRRQIAGAALKKGASVPSLYHIAATAVKIDAGVRRFDDCVPITAPGLLYRNCGAPPKDNVHRRRFCALLFCVHCGYFGLDRCRGGFLVAKAGGIWYDRSRKPPRVLCPACGRAHGMHGHGRQSGEGAGAVFPSMLSGSQSRKGAAGCLKRLFRACNRRLPNCKAQVGGADEGKHATMKS